MSDKLSSTPDDFREHALWLVDQQTSAIKLAELTTDELTALAALLATPHSRVLAAQRIRRQPERRSAGNPFSLMKR